MLMVGEREAVVEAELVGGGLACPRCGGGLRPWGRARQRFLRCAGGGLVLRRPRRARCRGCAVTHVLLPDLCLLRRRDEVAVIGAAIEAKAAGRGHRPIAASLGLHPSTVRGWLRCFVRGAEAIRAHFTRWAYALDPQLGPVEPGGGGVGDALEAIGLAARAFRLRLGRRPLWPLASALSGGLLLCNTSCPFPAVP